MRIVVTGGTGFVGTAIVQQLLERGHEVLLPVRPGSKKLPTAPPLQARMGLGTVRAMAVDPWDSLAAAEFLKGAGAIIHLVGIISEVGDQRFERVHTELTGRWLAAARGAGVRRWIQMSALGTRPDARSRYHRSKWAAECLVRDSGLDWTILRPSMIYGAQDGFTRLFASMARWSPVIPVLGGGHSQLQPIAVGQVARAFGEAAISDVSIGQTWDLCGPERISMSLALREILRVTGRRRALLSIPWPVARMQAAFLEFFLARCLGVPSPLTRDQILMLQEDNVGDGTSADAAFSLVHPDFRSGLEAYLGPRRAA